MADAFIYYRLKSNNTDVTATSPAYPDPKVISGSVTNRNTFVTNMEANHPTQILRFTLPNELLESVTMDYENNIKDAPVSEPDGVRRINKQDNGLSYIRYTFRGRFKDSATDLTILMNMAKRLQVESTTDSDALGFGIFGFFTDNTSIAPFNLDPISTKGLTLKSFNITRSGQQPKNFDFTIVMTFGGTY
jgi:hypothetical protein|tara:strand:+ start:1709 stop:2278 length:570 start_codon:yes stop_codon:yes gene_type:complete